MVCCISLKGFIRLSQTVKRLGAFAACASSCSLVLTVRDHARLIPALWPGLLYKCTSHKVGLNPVCAASSSPTREPRSVYVNFTNTSPRLVQPTAQLSRLGFFLTGVQSSTPKRWLTSEGKACGCTDGETRPCHPPAELAASPRAPSWQWRGRGKIPLFFPPTFKIRGFKIFMLVSFNMVPQSLTLNFLKLPIFKAPPPPSLQCTRVPQIWSRSLLLFSHSAALNVPLTLFINQWDILTQALI